MFKFIHVFTLVTLFASVGLAQDVESVIELVRSDIRTEKAEHMTSVMQFSDEEATVFWPVYREYQFELDKLGDAYLAVITEYAERYDSLDDKIATDLAKRAIEIRKDRLDLQAKYFGKFSKLLSPIRAARWLQLENQLGLIVELQLVAEIPFTETPLGRN